jgi:apolipoprotein N-acyltransferase
LLPVLASLLSSVLLILAFPPYSLGWLGWVALVPLLIAISNVGPRQGFVLSLISGVVSFAIIFVWVFEVADYKILHHFVLGLYLGPIFGIFGLVVSLITKRCGRTFAAFAGPFIWVSLEYVRSNMGFMAFPYAWLGYTQHEHPVVIQIASVAGAYGVSFLLAMVNSAVASFVLVLLYRSKNFNPRPNLPISKRRLIAIAGAAAFLTILTMCYGSMVVSRPTMGNKIRVSVIQGNIEQGKKWDRNYRNYILERYEELSRKASNDQPGLVIWPEAATPGFILNDHALLRRIMGLVREMNTYFLIGSSEYPKFQKAPFELDRSGNTALFFSPDGKVRGQYLKIRLLPFGEYLPYGETIPWSWIDVPKVNSTMPGKEFTVFQCATFRFSAPICWETLFPDLPREFVRRGAQFLVNITNEAWFGKSVGPQHYVISSVFRAVENRVYVVRCANTGISCFIDPFGRVVDRVKDDKGQDIFVRGVLTETVIPMESRTVYNQYGDWLVWICVGVSLIFICLAFWRRKPETDTPT